MPLLDTKSIEDHLKKLTHWEWVENEISRNFVCTDFRTAIHFVNHIAELAEEADHHPDILIHSWNNVSITLSTHREGGLTIQDFRLAEKIQTQFETITVA